MSLALGLSPLDFFYGSILLSEAEFSGLSDLQNGCVREKAKGEKVKGFEL